MKHILRATGRGWRPDDSIGLDPQTMLDQQQPGGAFYGPVGAIGQTLFVPMIAASDVLLRSGNTLLHGVASEVNQIASEAGLAGEFDRRLERDVLGLAEFLGSRFGGASGVATRAGALNRNAVNAARKLPGDALDRVAHSVPDGPDWIPQRVGDRAKTSHQKHYTERIERELGKENPQTTGFGRINQNLLNELNNIRRTEGEPRIGSREINVYANVFKKLQENRIAKEGMPAKEVAQLMYRVLHGKNTTVERGNHPTAQFLLNQTPGLDDTAFVGRAHLDDVSVKSVRPMSENRLEAMRRAARKRILAN